MDNPLDGLFPLLTAAGIVAGIAILFGILGGLVSRWLSQPLWPSWRRVDHGWSGGELLGLFLAGYVFLPAFVGLLMSLIGIIPLALGVDPALFLLDGDLTATVAGGAGNHAARMPIELAMKVTNLWASGIAMGLALLFAMILAIEFHQPQRFDWGTIPGQVAIGVLVWPVVSLVVFGIYLAALVILLAAGGEPQEHPFTSIDLQKSGAITTVFVGIVVIVFGPALEELLFRGIGIDWASRSRWNGAAFVIFGVLYSVISGNLYAIGFAGLLAIGFFGAAGIGRMMGMRFPRRSLQAIYATSAAFAVIHSTVWPSPVPLFVMGLILGWLRVRTGRITACIVVHGLFNAVSYLYLLRGAS